MARRKGSGRRGINKSDYVDAVSNIEKALAGGKKTDEPEITSEKPKKRPKKKAPVEKSRILTPNRENRSEGGILVPGRVAAEAQTGDYIAKDEPHQPRSPGSGNWVDNSDLNTPLY